MMKNNKNRTYFRTRMLTRYALPGILTIAALLWSLFTSMVGFARNLSPSDSRTFGVVFSTKNFKQQLLSATSDNVSEPNHATFSLQNGTPLWYSVGVSSSNLQVVPANQAGDLVASTFFSAYPLLPPAHVLPFDQWNGSYHFATLHLAAGFTNVNQQIQLQLTPIEPHAVTLDILTLILQILGQHTEGPQIGLLAPGELKDIFDSTSTMKDFTALVTNYSAVLQAAPDANAMFVHAHACALNLLALFSDASEQPQLARLLWEIQGKAISRDSIARAITGIAQTQFALAVEEFIKNQSLSPSSTPSQPDPPSVLLQTTSLTTSTPSVTP